MLEPYNPTKATENILEAAYDYIQLVEYKVGLRWVFYRLLQDGYLDSKDDYIRLKGWASLARKRFYRNWRPDTLVDEGRKIEESKRLEDREDTLGQLHRYAEIVPDLYINQPAVPFLIFEAATMSGQFKHFAGWTDRAAFRGDASIPHKWNIAKRCDELYRQHDKPVHILYFGDLDRKGLQIPESAMRDIWEWVDPGTEVSFTRCGINEGDADRFALSEKSLKPGTYEWESLESDDAGELIREGLSEVVDLDLINADIRQGVEDTEDLQEEVFEHLFKLYN